MDIIKNKTRVKINTKVVRAALIAQLLKMILVICKCLCYNKNYQVKFNKNLKKTFADTCNFFSLWYQWVYFVVMKSCLPMLIYGWLGKNYETLPEKEDFYSRINMKNITDADYMQAKRVCKDFEIKEFGEYDDLHVQGDTLLLAGVFNNL